VGYLFLQTWLWILFAGLLGLFVGWWIWGKRSEVGTDESSELKRRLEQCQSRCVELEAANGISGTGDDSAAAESEVGSSKSKGAASGSEDQAEVGDDSDQQDDADIQDDWRPAGFSGPDGETDDLKRIRGVGPVIERTLNDLGIYHFHQVAAFTDENIMWVDNHISFQGRIKRENWISQAQLLAEGGDTNFSNRYDRGNKGK